MTCLTQAVSCSQESYVQVRSHGPAPNQRGKPPADRNPARSFAKFTNLSRDGGGTFASTHSLAMASFLPEAGLWGKGMSKSSKQLQIYVVEDSPILMHLLAATIKTANAELVGHSDSAQRAISEISLLQPDLILIDIGLSFGSGFDVLRLLKERGIAHSASKVVLTNHANAEYKALSFRLGASQYYDKSSEILRVSELIRLMAAGHAASVRLPATGASQDGSKKIAGVDRAFLAQLAPLKGATITTPELNGPYTLTNTRIDSVVTQTSAGVYALGKTTGTGFGVSYVGRSDSDLNHALKARVGSYSQFKYGYLGSQRSAFENECKLYHSFSPPD